MGILGLTDHPEQENRYEITVTAETEEEAVVAFNEAFDDDENYTEAYDVHQYDEETFGVFFWSEDPIDTDDEPLVLPIEEVEA
ncbi:hypothetical protein HCTV-8_gp103 [Haloarcula virus HCTV-8]|uniref:Uncharacterized protein n=3 Tax=Haloferacalesvirus hv5 TaxID=1273753 RepID=A0AAE8XV75_9CAUD|nr:hypothetical protein HCTV-7_gp105 [Haloarcula phage HCTV-7]UBF20546.1 hypothetical protein HCTV-9_gp105 [Haloarcula phage HCTV-9]UBF20662.1 hypothetical protein HCTV-11_gp105 [Haloarcula phage HCTV-11]UBF21002.1 hypothetical protein HCTV-8_gp103 [Haloarcula virus HCTV-8]UBF21114.1 hypothetical protein HCTV-10_gp103 [Haloarcula virus HCTV-10]